jgi:hypothetical protein
VESTPCEASIESPEVVTNSSSRRTRAALDSDDDDDDDASSAMDVASWISQKEKRPRLA